MFFKKKNKKETIYKIIFCDENDSSTQFGEYDREIFHSYEAAKNRIESKANGWGYAIVCIEKEGWKIDGGWLKIKKEEK